MVNQRLRVGIIYGGQSSEHEVSLRSAASVFKRLDRTKFEPKTIYIDKTGKWHWADTPESFTQNSAESLPIATNSPEVVLLPCPNQSSDGRPTAKFVYQNAENFGKQELVDVIIPMVHGTNCEDGTLQGLLESTRVPYTGSGVLGSAIGMDKEVAKRLAEHAKLPVVPYRVARSWMTDEQLNALMQDAERTFGFPMFVKAAREGSSVGVYKVKTREAFLPAIHQAFTYDNKVLIEKAISAREIEFSVLQNSDHSKRPLVSKPAEIIPTGEFYTYDAKYNDENGAIFKIPAEISPELTAKMTQLAQEIFIVLEIEGYARVDLFLDSNSDPKNPAFYLNEVNTLPGFTSISMFPKLWEVSGIPYTDLLTNLISLAIGNKSDPKSTTKG